MTTKKQIRIDYTNNPKLAEIIGRKEIGDECSITFRIQIDERTPQQIVGTILEIEAEDYEGEPGDGTVEPTGQEPVAVTATG